MKLLSSDMSPFAGRARLAIYAGELPVEIIPANMWSSTGGKTAEYLALNPIGKVPTLLLDDGTALPESETIVEYLADAFPQARLRPQDPQAAAHTRLLARIVELYVMEPGVPLFGQLDPANRDDAVVTSAFEGMSEGLRHLDHFIADDGHAVVDHLTIADCALVPFLYFFPDLFGKAIRGRSPIDDHPTVARYWTRVQTHPAAARLLDEMRTGLATSRLRAALEGAI